MCELASNVYTLLVQLRGREAGLSALWSVTLRLDELALLYAAWPIGLDREAIRRAARAVGMDALCVVAGGADARRGSGISFDAAAFLEAIERCYNMPKACQLRNS